MSSFLRFQASNAIELNVAGARRHSQSIGYTGLVMPWFKRTHESYRIYWIFAGVASVMAGLFIASTPWANRKDNFIPVVERELAESQWEVRLLEKRIKALESKVGINTVGESSSNAPASY